MNPDETPKHAFDRGRAITKSLLGWGVVAGPFYLVAGLVRCSRAGPGSWSPR